MFVDKILSSGYNGIEIYLPASTDSNTEIFLEEIEDVQNRLPGFIFIVQQLTDPGKDTVEKYIRRMKKNLLELAAYQPTFINSHTGRDFYSFDDNCRVIEAALNISVNAGVKILHETHRGRFSFHSASLIPYLIKFPEMELVGDFSHFCTVSESLLQDQHAIISQIIPHVSHIHARVGHQQGPQVNDPFAPEWKNHLALFEGWWQQIIYLKRENGVKKFTITPEFGPAPYMPLLPFTQQPIGNQWEINYNMMHYLINKFKKINKCKV
jgi:sugar phosphate isomerase/epimerase